MKPGLRRCVLASLACVLFLLAQATAARACSVPVFRYALERWTPAPCELLVLREGPLSTQARTLLDQALASNTAVRLNLAIRELDCGPQTPPDLGALRARHGPGPVLALRFAAENGSATVAWAAPLSAAALDQLRDSPARARMAARLIQGDCGVWVLLESGQKSADDAAFTFLTNRLARLQRTIQLPALNPDDLDPAASPAARERLQRLQFSALRVARSDPAEAVLVQMLLRSEDDLAESDAPVAFPVFGRGRLLYALAGQGINAETIDEACGFLTGPCSCVVKEENPGLDLLIAADWEGRVVKLTRDTQPAGLPSLAAFEPPPSNASASAATNPVAVPPSRAAIAPGNPPPPEPVPPVLRRRLAVLAVLGAALVGAGAWFLSRRREV